ncbi:hypothetical protein RND71_027953 [Anisodus tanguticus]|uniref:Cellulose synthase n=1 Tax=Anisodus tanguticus TaxID=243964 RepID=A0AAE1V9L6_9SOLA|nr:hypothetical protein RND71_027953 [Anisodus tanguticus]
MEVCAGLVTGTHNRDEIVVIPRDGKANAAPESNEARQPLSRRLPIPSSQINPYRIIIMIRLVVLGFFFYYRVTHPVTDAYGLWLVSVICEIWFAVSWILDQFPKWLPIERETYLDRLSLRYEKEGKPSQISAVDIFASTVDPLKELPLVSANTVLSILAVDYPVDKVSCYVSDDGAAMLTFEALSETAEFAKKWIPFCKKFNIEPRAPESYFSQNMDYLQGKRDYEEFKVRVNALVAKAQKIPEEGWTMQDGTPWPGNNVRDHPGMIQVILGQNGGLDTDGNELPPLVYVRVSAVLTNAPYLLNLDCDHYINNSKAIREAICFLMDPSLGKRVCYVQFPQRFDGIDRNDRYANRNTVFFDINMKGLDGIQRPIYVGTGCVFRCQTLYGLDAPKQKKAPSRICNFWLKWCCCKSCCFRRKKKNKKPNSEVKPLRNDEDSLELVIGWIYGSVTEDILTGFKMHCHGWRSIYCMPKRPAFKGSAPINLSDRLHQVLRWALGSIEFFFQQALSSLDIITPELDNAASLWFLSLFICIFATIILEMTWSGVAIDEWWRNEQFWVIGGVSAHLFAVFQGLLKVLAGVDTNFTVTSKSGDEEFSELYAFKWITLLIPPTTLLLLNIIGVVAGISYAINNGYDSWGPLFGKLFFAFWVIIHLYPFLKGLLGRKNRTPTIIIVWSILLASIFSLLWVRIDPFLAKTDGPLLEECGLDCN